MKIYIAGKITNLKNYKEYFENAEKKLNDEGHLCMNPAILPEGFPWEIYMPICYAMIDACDYVYMLKNWVDSKGAKLELEYAKNNNKRIIYEKETCKNCKKNNTYFDCSQCKNNDEWEK